MRISCPHCGAAIQAEARTAGQTKTCPACHARFEVPAKACRPRSTWGPWFVVLVWMLLAVAVGAGSLLLVAALANATSAIQEAAIGAIFAAFFLAGYILARCVEKIVAWGR